MKKRGQIKGYLYFFIAVVVLFVLYLAFSSVGDIEKKFETTEIINFKTSIETKILQQSVRSKGSETNFSIAVPSSVQKVIFFDSSRKYNILKDPELISVYGDDKNNNLFLKTNEGYLPYSIDNLEFDNNPVSVRIENNRINMRLVSLGESVRMEVGEETNDIKCVSVFENGEPDKKIDVVFLGYGFNDIAEYNKQVNRYVNDIMLEFAPFDENRNKFNFYRVDDNSLECEITGFIQCDQYEIRKIASNCPHDYIFVLVDRGVVQDLIKPVRSSAIGNIAKINTADKPFVLVHEFGHSFGDLADEYVDEGYYSDSNFNAGDYVNCDYTGCSAWSNIDNTSCYGGCSLRKFYRPTQSSIMRSLSSTEYGPVNERELRTRLLYYE